MDSFALSYRSDCHHSAVATLSHNGSDGCSNDIGKLGAQIVNLPIHVVKPRVHIELNVPQLAGDESKLAFELRKSRFGQVHTAL